MADWNKIRAEYIRGDTSHRLLAEKYGVSRSAIAARCKREKWLELRGQKQSKANAKMADVAAEHEGKAASLIYSATEALLTKIAQQIVEAQALTPTDAANYTNAIERCKRICGVKDKPDADEQQARIEKLRKEAQTGTDDGSEGKVVVIPARVMIEESAGEEVSER